ncbi:ParB/RepB/Spo0J family partition protein [Ectothiorhodospira mobilis]|uniref:Probable chromosome-partitioning protein ParB n=1 Tax=Ectothiorhodospira mobilis TaxID=195064 RepID=A0A1I4SAG8_ECTMO|nr:ParB/RepB/Spo0J family partition protein [Ectothiorhodospira mobilis]MCG5536722.1 ParB/RepB/Spo0J family partition protein [Ectothiorhodospira mobilis]SFM61341.1 chromosome partitioning protein, ParB family [Ectothiorhodospira mobilis]
MARRKTGLGRGLDVLLSSANQAGPENDDPSRLRQVPVEHIRRGRYQPRVNLRPEALEELAASIRAQGVVQPVVVRPVEEGFELVAGERRWRAAQMAGLQEIPAVVRDIPDQAAAAMALIENIQREDLNPLEESSALQRLIREFGMTHQQVAESVGRSRTGVTNLLRLQDLEEGVKTLVEEGGLEMGHARALLGLTGPAQVEAARRVVDKGLSVRETERLVQSMLQENPAAEQNAQRPRNPDVERLESELSDRLGAPVDIRYDTRGRGRLVIRYNSLDELDGILGHIR